MMDNPIASGDAKPMLVVMDCGYGEFPGNAGAARGRFEQNVVPLEKVFLNDLIPEIDSSHRMLADRDHRAMAGLSPGGMQTLLIALENHEAFAWIGAFRAPMTGTMILPRSPGAPPPRAPSANLAQSARAITESRSTMLPGPPRESFDVKTHCRGAFAHPASFNAPVSPLMVRERVLQSHSW